MRRGGAIGSRDPGHPYCKHPAGGASDRFDCRGRGRGRGPRRQRIFVARTRRRDRSVAGPAGIGRMEKRKECSTAKPSMPGMRCAMRWVNSIAPAFLIPVRRSFSCLKFRRARRSGPVISRSQFWEPTSFQRRCRRPAARLELGALAGIRFRAPAKPGVFA